MELQVNSNDTQHPILFHPSTELEEIVQNVYCILQTVKDTVPLDREFGITSYIVDTPLSPSFQARVYSDVLDMIRIYEPRVELQEVSLVADESGKTEVIATILVKEVSS